MSSQPQPAQPQVQPTQREVPSQLDQLRYEVDLAHDVLTALQSRLEPVLGPVSPQTSDQDEVSCDSEVGESIRQSRSQVEHLTGRLRQILNRLEV